MRREQQHAFIAEDTLIFLQLFEKRVKLRVLLERLIANAVRLGVGLALNPRFLGAGFGHDFACLAVGGGADVAVSFPALVFVVGTLLAPPAAKALIDRVATRRRMAEAAQANVHNLHAIFVPCSLAQTRANQRRLAAN